jgi:hypothetical protein
VNGALWNDDDLAGTIKNPVTMEYEVKLHILDDTQKFLNQ